MAHTNNRPIDFTAPLNDNGSILKSVAMTIQKVVRSVAGKNVLTGQNVVVASSATNTSSGLSFQVKAGKQYRISGRLLITTNGTAGAKVGVSLPGTSAAVGIINFKYLTAAGITVVETATNSLAFAGTGAAANYVEVDIDGYFVPDVSGLLSIVFSQFASTAVNTSVAVGSNVSVYKTRG